MSERVLTLQSYRPPPWPDWRKRCLSSVRSWAASNIYSYRFIGDELFDPIPEDIRAACRGELLPLTDIGRLLWIKTLLADGWDRVIWLDADILIFDSALRLEEEVVGREIWISNGLKSGFRAAESVNNCVLSLTARSALLDRLLDATLAAVAAFDQTPHARALGPDLFRVLNRDRPLPTAPDIAMASPLMVEALAGGDAAPLAAHAACWSGPVRAANLCGSLISDHAAALTAVETLLERPAAFAPDIDPPVVEQIAFA